MQSNLAAAAADGLYYCHTWFLKIHRKMSMLQFRYKIIHSIYSSESICAISLLPRHPKQILKGMPIEKHINSISCSHATIMQLINSFLLDISIRLTFENFSCDILFWNVYRQNINKSLATIKCSFQTNYPGRDAVNYGKMHRNVWHTFMALFNCLKVFKVLKCHWAIYFGYSMCHYISFEIELFKSYLIYERIENTCRYAREFMLRRSVCSIRRIQRKQWKWKWFEYFKLDQQPNSYFSLSLSLQIMTTLLIYWKPTI